MIITTAEIKIRDITDELLRALDDEGVNDVSSIDLSIAHYQQSLDKVLEDNGSTRMDVLEKEVDEFVEESEEEVKKEKIISAILSNVEKALQRINPLDWDMNYKTYQISIHNYDSKWYFVYATCEQDALDILVDYLEEKGMTGYFLDKNEIEEYGEDGVVFAGNHSLGLLSEHLHIKEA